MDIESFSSIVWTAALVGAVISIYLAHHHHVLRIKRLLILELLKGYFQGNMAANQLGQRAREPTPWFHAEHGIPLTGRDRLSTRH
jgi:hypothetical protein